MQMLKERSPDLRMSSDLSEHHSGFQDPSLGASLFRPTEAKHSAKRWPLEVKSTPSSVESQYPDKKEPAQGTPLSRGSSQFGQTEEKDSSKHWQAPVETTLEVEASDMSLDMPALGEALGDKEKNLESNVIEAKSAWSPEPISKHPGLRDPSLEDFLLSAPPADKPYAQRESERLERQQDFPPPPPPPEPMVLFGWDHESAKPAPPPPYLPNSLNRAVLPISEFLKVLERLESYFKNQSIQALFFHSPPSVKLQTFDLVELFIQFWEAPDDQFCVDIQICRGDDIKFDNIMRRILEVIKGVDEPSAKRQKPVPQNEKTQNIQLFLEKLVPPKGLTDARNPTEDRIASVHAQLLSKYFSERDSGFDCLIHTTDMQCTLAACAREAALIVLSGKSPLAQAAEAFEQKCRDIQDVLIKVLVTREFSDEDAWNNGLAESSYPSFMKSRLDIQGFTDKAMMLSIQKVLMVLSNSLEVLTCSRVDTGKIHELLSSFLSQYSGVTKKSLASTLTSLMIDGCHKCLAVAYMACRVLRLLLALHPPLREELCTDSWIRKSIETALQTGRSRYSLLETESLLLLNSIMVP